MRYTALLILLLVSGLASAANPPSILNDSTHEVYQDQGNFAALGITCNTSSSGGTCSTAQAPSSSVLAINQTGSGVNLTYVPYDTMITYALSTTTAQYGVEGTIPLTPSVPYQIIGFSFGGITSSTGQGSNLTQIDQNYYSQLANNGLAFSVGYCQTPFSGDYPGVVVSSVLPNWVTTAYSGFSWSCEYAQGIEFSIASTSGSWTPINSGDGSMDVSSPSSTQNALQVVLSAMKLNHPSWTWFDVKGALRQTASNWATGYAPGATNAGVWGLGYGNINFVNANAVSSTSAIYLEPPGMSFKNYGYYVLGTLYPFQQARRAHDVVYIGGTWPSPATGCSGSTCNEYTAAQIAAAAGTKIYDSVTAITTPEVFTYAPAASGSATFVALTLDASGNGSRVESFMPNTQTFHIGSSCLQ